MYKSFIGGSKEYCIWAFIPACGDNEGIFNSLMGLRLLFIIEFVYRHLTE